MGINLGSDNALFCSDLFWIRAFFLNSRCIIRVLTHLIWLRMARNYDRLIRYYDSWFDDLSDPEKALTAEEQLQILVAIRECQRVMSVQPLLDLPIEIRRALSMATLQEQILRIIERIESARSRGSRGGSTTAARALAEQATENNIKREQERAETAAAIPEGYTSLTWYQELKKRAANGDAKAAAELKKM